MSATVRSWLLMVVSIVTGVCASGGSAPQVTSIVGSDVTLTCRPSVDAPVDWTFQQTRASDPLPVCYSGIFINGYKSNRFQIDNTRTGEYNLVIRSVLQNDSGIYTCIENGGLGEHHPVHLIVTVVDRPTQQPVPSTVPKITTRIAYVGQRIQLPCQNTHSDGQVSWRFEDTSAQPEMVRLCENGHIVSTYVARFKLDRVNEGDNNLVILNARLDDAGVYTCIEQSGERKRQTVRLIVGNDDKNVLVKVGSVLTLICDIYTPAAPRWSFTEYGSRKRVSLDDGNRTSGQIEVVMGHDRRTSALLIDNVQLSHAGGYSCYFESDVFNEQRYYVQTFDQGLACDILPSYSFHKSEKFKIECRIGQRGILHPTVTCLIGSSTTVVLDENDDFYEASLLAACDMHNEPCTCSAVFSVSANENQRFFKWKSRGTITLSGGCKADLTLPTAEESDCHVKFVASAIISGVLVVVCLALCIALFWRRCKPNVKPPVNEATDRLLSNHPHPPATHTEQPETATSTLQPSPRESAYGTQTSDDRKYGPTQAPNIAISEDQNNNHSDALPERHS